MYTEDTAGPGFWKSELIGLIGIGLIAGAFIVPPGPRHVYVNWLFGLIAGNTALGMSGNRRWERPVAAGAAIWLFISGFVPSVLTGQAWFINELSVGVVLVLTAVSAHIHLRDDVRHARPLTM